MLVPCGLGSCAAVFLHSIFIVCLLALKSRQGDNGEYRPMILRQGVLIGWFHLHKERKRASKIERAFVATGTNLSLQFFPASWQGEQRQTPTREYVDFEREGGKVRRKLLPLKDIFILC
uniref:Uncharacterized protein n=1 Tax=Meleagris gallopavo TaxID=9103 RepID=A0A803Y1E1_MELGA